jgi:hypothetical protein
MYYTIFRGPLKTPLAELPVAAVSFQTRRIERNLTIKSLEIYPEFYP